MFLTALVNRRWRWVTAVVILIVAGLARLGIWQLDRRVEKIELNRHMAERWLQEPFDLTQERLPVDLADLQFRRIQASGKFDHSQQVAVKGVNRNELPGVALLTPFIFADGRAVLVVRGWIPIDKAKPEQWAEFDEPAATSTVLGLIRESQTAAAVAKPTEPQKEWFRVDIAALQAQMPYPLLPAFVEMLREPDRPATMLPLRAAEPAPFDDLMHLSYAAQWFMFALIGGFGYLMLVRQQEMRRQRLTTPDSVIHEQSSVSRRESDPLVTDH